MCCVVSFVFVYLMQTGLYLLNLHHIRYHLIKSVYNIYLSILSTSTNTFFVSVKELECIRWTVAV